MLQRFSHLLERILHQLPQGAVSIAPAHQPLALTALLSAMAPGGNVSLANTQHPVIQVSFMSHADVNSRALLYQIAQSNSE